MVAEGFLIPALSMRFAESIHPLTSNSSTALEAEPCEAITEAISLADALDFIVNWN